MGELAGAPDGQRTEGRVNTGHRVRHDLPRRRAQCDDRPGDELDVREPVSSYKTI